jgi:outer membrane protein TolC
VLERRPDVRAPADQVEASTARLQSAKTELLPTFNIQFLGKDGHIHIDGLPGASGVFGLANLNIYLPIFTAGRIQANIGANDARLQASVAAYDKAVLAALEEVENAYSVRNSLDHRRAAMAAALATAQHKERTAVSLFEAGRKTLDEVLNARLESLNDEDELVQVEMARATATVALYRALGGGW